jgi:hypothetical protein
MLTLTDALTQLQDIASDFYLEKIERNHARSAVLEVFLEKIKCSRVSLWRFDGEPGALRLLCFSSKSVGQPLVTTPSELLESEYSQYFDGLIKTGMYVCDAAQQDMGLLPMRKTYLVPNRVMSTLDSAFMLNGRAYGMVCCEQTDVLRHWHSDDAAALRAMVAKLAIIMASSQDAVLWRTPSLSMEPLAQGNSRPGRFGL